MVLDVHEPAFFNTLPALPMAIKFRSISDLLALALAARFADQNCVLVSPDRGGLARVNELALALGWEIAVFEKKRPQGTQRDFSCLSGRVAGKVAVVVDDLIDSGNTLLALSEQLHDLGAQEIHAMVVHGLFTGPAISGLENSRIQSITISNSILNLSLSPKFFVLDIRHFLRPTLGAAAQPKHAPSQFVFGR